MQIEIYNQPEDVRVFGNLVKTFPNGIGEAFSALMTMIPDGDKRAYYGLSEMDKNGGVLYWATAEEKSSVEPERYGCASFTVPAGEYLSVIVQNWRSNTDCIKDVFEEVMKDERADKTKRCIEWYYSDTEMKCLLQTNTLKELFAALDKAAKELNGLLAPLSEAEINTVPFKDSWTPAQLARHITKSNKGMAQALEMKGKPANRNPAEKIKELKDTFLNFSLKMKSPDFIVPEPGEYKKEAMLSSLKKSSEKLEENAAAANPNEMINLPAAFGEITKLELFHFVLYHTQRHIHQLKNIIQHI
ncbi:MAG: DinB family protein [Bacteroidota bacterium]